MKISNPQKLDKKIAKVEAKSYKKTLKFKHKEELKLAKKAEKMRKKFASAEEKKKRKQEKRAEKAQISLIRKYGSAKASDTKKPKETDFKKPVDKEAETEKLLLSIAKEQNPVAGWLNLDNAALIFPAGETADISNMFRVSAVLREPVDPILLQKALNLIVPRFPSLTSSLKRGLFWYYLEPSNKPLVVEKQKDFPCRKIGLDARNALIRVTYFSHEVAVEILHVATDGNGGITFLNSLLCCYFKLQGKEIADKTNCLNHLDKPKPEELADSYQQFFDNRKLPRAKDKKAYRLSGKKLPAGVLLTVKGIISSSAINAAAKARGLTVGQLLTACLIYAIEEDRNFYLRKNKLPVVIGVPINIRKFYESKTLRNFVALMHIENENSGDFDALCQSVKQQFEKLNNVDFLKSYVNFNVRIQKNKFFRLLPLPVKNVAMKLALKMFSDNVTTSTFSNLGRIAAPQEFKDKVLRYEFNLGPQSTILTSLCGASYNDTLVLTFARVIEESGVEKYFFRKLRELDIPVAVESNFEL